MNPTIELMNARSSTRAYTPTPLSDEEKQAILHTTMRAPTAGNLMLYSIIEIEDQALKDRLAVTCDDQPFIATAPWVLVFVADYQKWIDLFAVSGVGNMPGVRHRGAPGPGDLLDACCDALIAAQNAVIAAETKRLVDLAQLTAAAGLPLQEAFRTAVHPEDSLIEWQVFVVSGEDSPEVAEVLGTLKEQTERHQKHLAESLSKFSGGSSDAACGEGAGPLGARGGRGAGSRTCSPCRRR